VATQARHPRAAPAQAVAAAVRAAGGSATVASDAAAALCEATDCCPPQGIVVVAGSVFLAGEALEALACICRADAC
jgi:folylpolyglutamate synthase/dihydropteroate synthase